jgi:hypothetical protein
LAAIRQALPEEYRNVRLDSGAATWLSRTLRSVEAAGLDPGQVAEDAVRSAPLTGARDLAAVIDYRIRKVTAGIAPAPWQPWSERIPQLADPKRQQLVTELAAAMDARRARIGEHASQTSPTCATNALGPVPEDPLDRLNWTERASAIGAYRELYGIEPDTDPIGPEPVKLPRSPLSMDGRLLSPASPGPLRPRPSTRQFPLPSAAPSTRQKPGGHRPTPAENCAPSAKPSST